MTVIGRQMKLHLEEAWLNGRNEPGQRELPAGQGSANVNALGWECGWKGLLAGRKVSNTV